MTPEVVSGVLTAILDTNATRSARAHVVTLAVIGPLARVRQRVATDGVVRIVRVNQHFLKGYSIAPNVPMVFTERIVQNRVRLTAMLHGVTK